MSAAVLAIISYVGPKLAAKLLPLAVSFIANKLGSRPKAVTMTQAELADYIRKISQEVPAAGTPANPTA